MNKSLSDWKNILNLDGLQLQYLPQEYFNDYDILYELHRIALNQNGLALQYITDEYRTKEVIELALYKNITSIHYISEINEEILDYIFNIYGFEIMQNIKMDNPIFNNYMEDKHKINLTKTFNLNLSYYNHIYTISYYELLTYFNNMNNKNNIELNNYCKESYKYTITKLKIKNCKKIIEQIKNLETNIDINDETKEILIFLGKTIIYKL